MIIHATFVNFTYDPEVVELVHAWDEYSLDNNPTGYEDSKREALATYEGTILNKVTVDIRVDENAIANALSPHLKLEGKVIT